MRRSSPWPAPAESGRTTDGAPWPTTHDRQRGHGWRRSPRGRRFVGTESSERSRVMRKAFEIGGLVAAAVLIAFGVAAIVMGVQGSKTVNSSLKQEAIVGTPDMTRDAIAAEAKKAGLPSSIELPTANIAGKAITNGTLAREFAKYMRIHTLEATGGLTYAQMGRYQALSTAPAKRSE